MQYNLNPRQQAFAELIILGSSATDAYLAAGYKAATREIAHRNASRLRHHQEIYRYIDELRSRADQISRQDAVFTLADKLTLLARIVLTGAGDVTPGDPLAQHHRIYKDGSTSTRLPDKLRALKLHSELAGHFPMTAAETIAVHRARAQQAEADAAYIEANREIHVTIGEPEPCHVCRKREYQEKQAALAATHQPAQPDDPAPQSLNTDSLNTSNSPSTTSNTEPYYTAFPPPQKSTPTSSPEYRSAGSARDSLFQRNSPQGETSGRERGKTENSLGTHQTTSVRTGLAILDEDPSSRRTDYLAAQQRRQDPVPSPYTPWPDDDPIINRLLPGHQTKELRILR